MPSLKVPNVPCGVESWAMAGLFLNLGLFLMYRVELKDGRPNGLGLLTQVPNVPCGVERFHKMAKRIVEYLFLMYRVELKGRTH